MSSKHKKEKKQLQKKAQLNKLISKSSDSEEESEHELSYYLNDRVKLMKEVLKIIKQKKIISMAPDCMKNMDMGEIKAILLEELLGISNKRVKYIFEGKNLDEDTSSSEEDEDRSVDVISLDDVSDGDLVIEINSDDNKPSKKSKKHKVEVKEEEPRKKKVKKEKLDKDKNKKSNKDKEKIGEENLMSVLELLELQARARAIRSQLALEAERKTEEANKKIEIVEEIDEDEIIIEIPKNEEIVITDSENEKENENEKSHEGNPKEDISTEVNIQTQGIEESRVGNSKIAESVKNIVDDIEEKSELTKNVVDFNDCQENSPQILEEVLNKINENSNVDVTKIPLPEDFEKEISNVGKENLSEKVETIRNIESQSDSDDNLQTVKLREKRRKEGSCKSNEIDSQSQSSAREKSPKTNQLVEIGEQTSANQQNSEIIESVLQDYKTNDSLQNDTSSENQSQNDPSSENQSQNDKIANEDQLQNNKMAENPAQNESEDETLKKRNLRLKNLQNRLKSYKNEVGESNKVKIIDNVVLNKANEVSEKIDEEEIIINVDEEEMECIVCD